MTLSLTISHNTGDAERLRPADGEPRQECWGGQGGQGQGRAADEARHRDRVAGQVRIKTYANDTSKIWETSMNTYSNKFGVSSLDTEASSIAYLETIYVHKSDLCHEQMNMTNFSSPSLCSLLDCQLQTMSLSLEEEDSEDMLSYDNLSYDQSQHLLDQVRIRHPAQTLHLSKPFF